MDQLLTFLLAVTGFQTEWEIFTDFIFVCKGGKEKYKITQIRRD